MTWVLKAKVELDKSPREFYYETEEAARKGYEAMLNGGYIDVTLEEVDDDV